MILIIAYGNSLRRDDGAGLLLGEMLERIWRDRTLDVQRIAVHQLTPDLAESIAGDGVSAVVFVDTRVARQGSDGLDVEVHALISGEDSPSLGHYLDPGVLMVYVRLLYGRDPLAWLVTVPGVDFGHGEGLSETAANAIERASKSLSIMAGSVLRLDSSCYHRAGPDPR